jgi:hypothetical protein
MVGIDSRLLPTDSEKLFLRIKEAGFDPTDFKWSETSDHWETVSKRPTLRQAQYRVSVLTFKSFDFYCKFGPKTLEYSPGEHYRVASLRVFDRSDRTSGAATWLKYIKRQLEATDYWGIIARNDNLKLLVASPDEVDNRPFTKTEQEYIRKQLEEIKRFMISTGELTGARLDTLKARVDYLTEASTRMGRKDWYMVLMGGMITLVVAAVVSPERIQALFQMVADAFLPLFQSLLRLDGQV